MSSSDAKKSPSHTPRKRMAREDRNRQLLDVAWKMIHDDGTEALSLGSLAEQAGVTKPVVYDHFGTRSGLLIALYQDYDRRQTALMDSTLAQSSHTLRDKASVIASAYIDCVLSQGREISGVIASLAGSPELEQVKRDYHILFIDKCRDILSPFSPTGKIPIPRLWGFLGAAESLSYAAATGEITADQAKQELFETIIAMVSRDKA
ncbi:MULTISPECIES: TetR/AcrR family transcriptional regulator [Thalassospira]|jgi:AcrR family transcriptional regulator|uniref:TetR family transcriptional regulator n=1 Tax=Thalassospira xiamenensis TaxID=220697 RepID=A0ABR5Y4M3_9PROT|nr:MULTISPECIES: TetR/AcrR family transcriptional regulator [Thalassospira]MBL4842446.1 TetR/AcrR family transcriptional regulator [Thalassospira sp.]MBR9781157.1 TetR/AcrR family transcriptional regulator [Rhodospirillales bacterium]KZD04156.1 TetR family transcriptional regulator [Thalassospira xiamenensis]KZD05247.1 TetR family transcriptional regulator [Thalassospira xiamenensis]MBR9817767.1 TetR/AcrR family transcriptional regulator [Rhodospirillales bacterium]